MFEIVVAFIAFFALTSPIWLWGAWRWAIGDKECGIGLVGMGSFLAILGIILALTTN